MHRCIALPIYTKRIRGVPMARSDLFFTDIKPRWGFNTSYEYTVAYCLTFVLIEIVALYLTNIACFKAVILMI
jgi:hypothetical protein